MMRESHVKDAFALTIAATGMAPPVSIIADGKIHRFSPTGNARDKTGWYILFVDGSPAGKFGNWKTGLTQSWHAREQKGLSVEEIAALRNHVNRARDRRDAHVALVQKRAARTAERILNQSLQCDQHPYLTAKGLHRSYGARLKGRDLVIPMRDHHCALRSLQIIHSGEEKRFLAGGRIKGTYFSIGIPSDALIVCEGFATGASLHEATGYAVAVAFTAGNLKAVAVALRSKWPSLRFAIAADDDWLTPGNPGLSKAAAAAIAIKATVIRPTFPVDRHGKATDFNDLHALCGLDAVRACFKHIGENNE